LIGEYEMLQGLSRGKLNLLYYQTSLSYRRSIRSNDIGQAPRPSMLSPLGTMVSSICAGYTTSRMILIYPGMTPRKIETDTGSQSEEWLVSDAAKVDDAGAVVGQSLCG
jgi:hypothetical protein